MRIKIQNESSLPEVAGQLARILDDHRLVAFDGPMGAGKTTLIAALCRELGMADEASSPTFSIINEYTSADGSDIIYHFDFYRLEGEEDAMEIGVEDYFNSGRLCLMEWAENIGNILPEETLVITVAPQADGSRILDVPL